MVRRRIKDWHRRDLSKSREFARSGADGAATEDGTGDGPILLFEKPSWSKFNRLAREQSASEAAPESIVVRLNSRPLEVNLETVDADELIKAANKSSPTERRRERFAKHFPPTRGGNRPDKHVKKAMRRALARLPAPDQRILDLWMHEYTAAEIGEQMGLTENAVAKRVERAKKALRDAMQPWIKDFSTFFVRERA